MQTNLRFAMRLITSNTPSLHISVFLCPPGSTLLLHKVDVIPHKAIEGAGRLLRALQPHHGAPHLSCRDKNVVDDCMLGLLSM